MKETDGGETIKEQTRTLSPEGVPSQNLFRETDPQKDEDR